MKKIFAFSIIFAILLNACTAPTPVTQETQLPVETEPQVPIETQAPPAAPTDTLAPSPTPTYAPVKLKMNAMKTTGFSPIYFAQEEGYFTEQNIELELIPFDRSTEALALLANGDFDVFAGSISPGLLNTIGVEQSIAAVADRGYLSPDLECAYMGILLRQDLFDSGEITRPSQFKGQTIAASAAGTTGYLLSQYIKQDGLTLKDVEVTDVPPAATAEAFANKSIFAASLPDPWLTTIEATGNASLFVNARDVIPGYQIGVLVFGPTLIKNNPDVGVRFMVAYLKGVKQYQLGKTDQNLDIIAKYTELLKEDIKAACWPPIREDGMIQFSSTEYFQNWAIENGLLDNPVTEDKFWNPYFVEQAYARLQQ